MSTNIYLEPTLDPTALPLIDGPCGSAHGITASHLLQLARELQPAEGFGFVVWGTDAPDVGTYPELARFLWIDTNDTPHVLKQWDGAGWAAFIPDDNSLNGSVLIANSVALSKLAVNVADFGKVLVARSGGPQWEQLVDNLAAGSIAISKLAAPSTPVGAYLTLTSANTLGWQVLHGEDIIARIVNGTLPINRLVAPGATVGHVLKVHTDNTITTDAAGAGDTELPVYTVADSGKKLQVNSAGNGVEWVALTSPTIPNKYISAEVALPTQPGTSGTINGTGMVQLAHGLGQRPHIIDAYFVCQDAEAGYSVGAMVPYTAVKSNRETQLYLCWADATNIYLMGDRYLDNSEGIGIISRDPNGDEATVFTLAKWKAVLVAIKFN